MNRSDIISAIALVVAIVTGIFSIVQGESGAQRDARTKLSDVLARISDTVVEVARLKHEAGRDKEYVNSVTDNLYQKEDFLLQEAMNLAEQIPTLSTSADWLTIALSIGDRNDPIAAERCYKRAVDSAPAGHYRLVAEVDYATFLFGNMKEDEGRKEFSKAVDVLPPSDDYSRSDRGWAYEKWGWQERNVANSPTFANERFDSARAEFNYIHDEGWRNDKISELDRVAAAPSPSPTPSVHSQ